MTQPMTEDELSAIEQRHAHAKPEYCCYRDTAALLAEVRRLRAAERCHVEEMTGDYCRWCHPNEPTPEEPQP